MPAGRQVKIQCLQGIDIIGEVGADNDSWRLGQVHQGAGGDILGGGAHRKGCRGGDEQSGGEQARYRFHQA